MTLAAAIERHARAIVHSRLGNVGRFDRLTITAVDAVNRVATCTAPSGGTVYATWTGVLPAVGQDWIGFRTASGSYVLTTICR